MVDGRFFGHFFWKVVGSCAHKRESRTATVHGAPYMVNSRVMVGAIYAYMCTYSYRTRCTIHGELTCGGGGNIRIHVYLQLPYMVHHTRCTHVWWWGQYTHTCVPTATVHGASYTVHRIRCTHVWWWGQYTHTCVPTATVRGAPYTVHHTWGTVHGELMCGGGIHVWELLTCAGDIHVWELLTCETSHQSEILHSLIFLLCRTTKQCEDMLFLKCNIVGARYRVGCLVSYVTRAAF